MKPGSQTSEFWLAVGGMGSLVILALALIITKQTDQIGNTLQYVGLALAGMSGAYSASRGYAKGQIGGEAQPPEAPAQPEGES